MFCCCCNTRNWSVWKICRAGRSVVEYGARNFCTIIGFSRVADPHNLNSELDPAFHFNAIWFRILLLIKAMRLCNHWSTAALWNRNRSLLKSRNRNRNSLQFRNRNWIQNYVFDYLYLNLFSFTFYNKFVEIYKLFPCKTAYFVKRKKN